MKLTTIIFGIIALAACQIERSNSERISEDELEIRSKICSGLGDSLVTTNGYNKRTVKYYKAGEHIRSDYYYCDRLMNIAFYSEGMMNGYRFEFNEDGTFYFHAQYVNDTVNGVTETYWHDYGQIKQSEYDMGVRLNSDTFKIDEKKTATNIVYEADTHKSGTQLSR